MLRRVTTRVVIDIESNEVIERESYQYDGKWAEATNVTWQFVASGEGCILGRHDITAATPAKDGIDLYNGGYGSRLRLDGLSSVTPKLPIVYGSFGATVFSDSTQAFSYFVPQNWEGPQYFGEETPAAATPTRGRSSWVELEIPLIATRGRVSWAEFEFPTTITRGRISWAEFEVPSATPNPTRGLISWAELEIPNVITRGRVSWAEFELPTLATRGRISWAEFEVPNVGPVVTSLIKELLSAGIVYTLIQSSIYALPVRKSYIYYQGTAPEVSSDGVTFTPISLDNVARATFIRSSSADTKVKVASRKRI